MKRFIDHFLLQWKKDSYRKPLLLRGARQVGKTYSVRNLGKTYDDFVEINFELIENAKNIFEQDLMPDRILRELSLIVHKTIIPGKTLLFLDEIQKVPQAIIALRYFYEMLPELHVIAAGSLLDFAIEQVGVPVGRVEFLYIYPLSFIEYLVATGKKLAVNEILNHGLDREMSSIIHDMILDLLGEYLAIGGMPQSIQNWIDKKDPLSCTKFHNSILDTYRQDFGTYARRLQVKYVELIFEQIPLQLGRKFKYSLIEGDYRKRELAPAFDLLVTAGVSHKVFYSAGQGLPIGAQIDLQDYKAIFLDVGLAQALVGFDIADWFLNPKQALINKGPLIESFVGQELLAYSNVYRKNNLYYWHKEAVATQAEIDYITKINGEVVPVEVKAGLGKTIKSLHFFLETHKQSTYGVRFSANNYSIHDKIHSYPLYAIIKLMLNENTDLKDAIQNLL